MEPLISPEHFVKIFIVSLFANGICVSFPSFSSTECWATEGRDYNSLLYSQWVSWLWQKNPRLGLLSNLFNHHFKCSECVGVFFFKVCALMRVVTSKWAEAKWNYRHKDKIKKKQTNKQWTENLGGNSNSVKSCGIWPNWSFFTYASDKSQTIYQIWRLYDSVCVHTHIHTSTLPYDSVYACVCVRLFTRYEDSMTPHMCVCVHTHIHTSILPSPQKIKKIKAGMLKQEVNTEIRRTRITWKEKIHTQARSDKNKQTISNVKKILIQRKFTKQH